MKHMFLTLSLATIMGAMTAGASTTFDSGVLKYTTLTDSTVTLAGYAANAANKDKPNVVIPETVTYENTTYEVIAISASAFRGDTIIQSVSIPGTVQTIGAQAFMNATTLTTVTIAEGVQQIKDRCFMHTSLAAITIPSTVYRVWDYAFSNTLVENVIIPATVDFSTNDKGIFKQCPELKTVTFAEGSQRVPEMGFGDCPKLEEVNLPSTIWTIKAKAFLYLDLDHYIGGAGIGYPVLPLTNFKVLNCGAVNPPALGTYVFDSLPETAIINVPAESVAAYKAADGWSATNVADKIVNDPAADIESVINVENNVEAIYNLQGMRVNRADMGHGIFIINGKKVIK